jgi:hypothetical protein
MAYVSFFNKSTSIHDSSFPLKKIKSSKLNSRKPWVSNGLLKSIKRKNKLKRQYLSFPTAQHQWRSQGLQSGGQVECQKRDQFGGSGGMLPRENFEIQRL